jgi:hypothetical protein
MFRLGLGPEAVRSSRLDGWVFIRSTMNHVSLREITCNFHTRRVKLVS